MKKISTSTGGKGSDRRASSVTHDKFQENWDRIFGKKDITPPTAKVDEKEVVCQK
jgi:hypothetical protein